MKCPLPPQPSATPLPAEIFKAYDIRGIVGKTLTSDTVRRIGHGLGSLAAERGQRAIAVGRDGRLSGPELAAALMEGIRLAGIDSIDIGCVPTPVAYFAAHELGCDSCVAVTGSHNPPDYNGLKMVVGGETLAGETIQASGGVSTPASCAMAGARPATPMSCQRIWHASSPTFAWHDR